MNTNQLIEQALGIPVQQSPVYTAKALLAHLYKGKEQIIRNTTFDLRNLPFVGSAYDIIWRRELTLLMIGLRCHHYDKNSMYLAACSATDMGVGDPVHLNDGDDNTCIEPGTPGIYRVSCRYFNSLFNGFHLPVLIRGGQEWVTNDQLVFMLSHGYQMDIHEAWVFPEHERVLGNRNSFRNWARKLWGGRQELKGVDEEAYQYIGQVAHQGLGSFATGKERYSGLAMIHPNWFFDTVGMARVAMFANLEKFASFITPVLIEVDGLWFVTGDENPRTAVPGILDRENLLGGYKHESSFILTKDIIDQARDLTPGALASLLKGAGHE